MLLKYKKNKKDPEGSSLINRQRPGHVVIGNTKASKLLKDGFEFYKKNPNDQIRNSRNNHFYYGELAELIRDGKSYGIVSLTPK